MSAPIAPPSTQATSNRSPDSHITEFIIADGWLRQISSDSRSVEYTVHNAASEPRSY